jgi:hypothetical protein
VVGYDKSTPIDVGMVTGMTVDIPFTSSLALFNRPSHAVHFMTIRALAFINHWGFALSANGDGQISHCNRHRDKNGWEGWVIECTDNKNVFLSRNMDQGHFVIAIDDEGHVRMTENRVRAGWEEFELTFHRDFGVLTFQRVREPRFFLACSNEGRICSSRECNLEGMEAWTPE